MEVGRILSRSRRAVKFGLNGHSTRVRGKTWLCPSRRSLLRLPSSSCWCWCCCCGRWRWGARRERRSRNKSFGSEAEGREEWWRRKRRRGRRIREAVRNILTYITAKLGRGYAAANLSFRATFHRHRVFQPLGWQIAGYVVPPRDLTRRSPHFLSPLSPRPHPPRHVYPSC